jgi:hypothetical protein
MKSPVAIAEVTNPKKVDKRYKGLEAYSEADWEKFFGRAKDTRRIVNSFLAWRLTVLYGSSGVGKSSVLGAGVAHTLREKARQNMREHAVPKLAVVIFPPRKGNWQDDPLQGLIAQINQQIDGEMDNLFFPFNNVPSREPKLSFVETLEFWTKIVGGGDSDGWLFIILDQFEEYFQYYPSKESDGGFISEIAKAIKKPNLHVNFLISLREDFYVNLNRLRGDIPNILEVSLQIKELTKAEAKLAIENPITQYQPKDASEQPISIAPELVHALLRAIPQVKSITESDRGGAARQRAIEDNRVSPPYLQLVMVRLLQEMKGNCLSLQTLIGLDKGKTQEKTKYLTDRIQQVRMFALILLVKSKLYRIIFFLLQEYRIKNAINNIVQDHVTRKMAKLSEAQKKIAARIFQYLVTPSGTKYAYSITDLAERVNCEEEELFQLLEELSKSDRRIIKRVHPSPDVDRYEIFHDFLASPILEWQRKYIEKKEREKRDKKLTRKFRKNVVLILLGLFAFVVGIELPQISRSNFDDLKAGVETNKNNFNKGEQILSLFEMVLMTKKVEKNLWNGQRISSLLQGKRISNPIDN